MKMPPNIGPVHFIGIGGIGMSGIAEVLVNLGYNVQGSDQGENANVQRLRELGVKIFVGHSAENLGQAEVVVVVDPVHWAVDAVHVPPVLGHGGLQAVQSLEQRRVRRSGPVAVHHVAAPEEPSRGSSGEHVPQGLCLVRVAATPNMDARHAVRR